MPTSQNHITTIEFISNLTFDYVETYSFQRGIDFEENANLIKPEYESLKVRKENKNNLTSVEEKRFLVLQNLFGFTQYIINEKGIFHPSGKKTNRFQFTDPLVRRLISILKIEIKNIPQWMCAPTYRDALAFYNNKEQIISTLNICLDCQYMETKMHNHINADIETYDLLKLFFIDIGHDVEVK